MDKKKIEELREQNKLIAKAIKEIIAENKTTEEKIYWTKKLNNFEACGDIRTRANGNNYVYNCREKFCCVCQEKEKNKRFLKLYNEAFNISREKLETGYVEAFLTLNYNYNAEEIAGLSLAEQIKFFKKLLNKFKKKAEKMGSIGAITKIEFPYLHNIGKFQIHSHMWICIEEKNIFQLQEIWKKITNQEGNLHIGSDNKEENAETKLYYKCGNKKRNGNISVKRICNYLAKHYISTALQSNNENEEKEAETQENRTCGTFEKIKNIEVLKQLIKATTGELEAFQCLSINGIYNKTNAEKERKKEKSRRFSVIQYDPKMLEANSDDCNIFRNKNDLLVEYKSNNNTIKAIERKYGGKVEVIKGKGVWADTIELGEYEQIRKAGMVKKKPIVKKKTPVTTEKTTVETFEIFGNIEEIKQKIINTNGAMAWATKLVQVILPYTNIKQQSDEDKQTIEKLEKRVKELEKEARKFKVAKTFSDEKQSEKENDFEEKRFIIIKNENDEATEVEEYKMQHGGGYCYITKDKKSAYVNTMFAKKYDKKSFKAEKIEHYKNFEEFNKEYQLKKTF